MLSKHSKITSLNPCFNGRYSQSINKNLELEVFE